MIYRYLADFVVFVHAAFVLWVVLGAFVVLRWPKALWWHLPAMAWGAGITLVRGVCPLTPLENSLREAAGQAGYEGGFIQHYFMPLIYSGGVTRERQLLVAATVALVNVVLYFLIIRKLRDSRNTPDHG